MFLAEIKWNPELLLLIMFPFVLGVFMLISLIKAVKKVNFINKMRSWEVPVSEVTGIVKEIKGIKASRSYVWLNWFFVVEVNNIFLQKTTFVKSEIYVIPWGYINGGLFWKIGKNKLLERLSSIIKEGDPVKVYISPTKPKYCYIEDKANISSLKWFK